MPAATPPDAGETVTLPPKERFPLTLMWPDEFNTSVAPEFTARLLTAPVPPSVAPDETVTALFASEPARLSVPALTLVVPL